MAAASLDVNFKEELSAIEQCKQLSFFFHFQYFNAIFTSRVQSSFRSRAHSRSLQSSATFDSSSNQVLHHRSSTDGKVGSYDCSPQPRHGRFVVSYRLAKPIN
jgi:hypothetical protein